jgi:hypothetical protein
VLSVVVVASLVLFLGTVGFAYYIGKRRRP